MHEETFPARRKREELENTEPRRHAVEATQEGQMKCDVCHRTFETAERSGAWARPTGYGELLGYLAERLQQHRAFRDQRGGHGHPYPSVEDEHAAWERAIDVAKREWEKLSLDWPRSEDREHLERDAILLRLLATLSPDLAEAMEDREAGVRYWYA